MLHIRPNSAFQQAFPHNLRQYQRAHAIVASLLSATNFSRAGNVASDA